jgi:beta-phosphoglucomutase
MLQLAVIFDMDGVIADTNPTHDVAWRKFLTRYDIVPTDDDLQNHMYGKHNSYILNYFLKREIVADELLRLQFEKEALFRELYTDIAQPLPGLLAFLGELYQNGVKLGIATSAPVENLEMMVSQIPFLNEVMGSMLSEKDVSHHKPHPEVYLKSAARLGIDPSQCIVFEDSVSGVNAGLAAGMKVVGVTTSHTAEDLPPCSAYINDYLGLSFEFIQQIMDQHTPVQQ